MGTHSSIPAWRIPRTGSLVGYGPESCKESDRTEVTWHACVIYILIYEMNNSNDTRDGEEEIGLLC